MINRRQKKHMVKFNPCSITLRLLTSIGFGKLNFFGWFWWVSQHFTSLHWTRRWFSFIVLKMTLLSLENEYTKSITNKKIFIHQSSFVHYEVEKSQEKNRKNEFFSGITIIELLSMSYSSEKIKSSVEFM